MPLKVLISIRQAAAFFGVARSTISDLIRSYGIKTKPMKRNGKGRGLDMDDLRILAVALAKPIPTLDDILAVAIA